MSETQLLACPCCGYRTISESFDICDICRWEHDPVMEESPDEEGGANGICLREAQRNFARFGACTEESTKYVRRPTAEDERDPNWKPIV
jgi:hypothetical protein